MISLNFQPLYLLLGRNVHVAVHQCLKTVDKQSRFRLGHARKSSGKANKAVHNCHGKSGNEASLCAPQEHGSQANGKAMEMLVDLRLNVAVERLPCDLLEMKFSTRLFILVRLPALLPNVRLH